MGSFSLAAFKIFSLGLIFEFYYNVSWRSLFRFGVIGDFKLHVPRCPYISLGLRSFQPLFLSVNILSTSLLTYWDSHNMNIVSVVGVL